MTKMITYSFQFLKEKLPARFWITSNRHFLLALATLLLSIGVLNGQNVAITIELPTKQASSSSIIDHPPTRIISGFVSDAKTGNLLVGATIWGFHKGTVCAIDGYFEMELPNRPITLDISYLGYSKQSVQIGLGQLYLEVGLKPGTDLDEIVVSAMRERSWCNHINVNWSILSPEENQKTPEEKAILYLEQVSASPIPSRIPPQLMLYSPTDHHLQLQLFDASGQLLWQDEWELIPGQNQQHISPNWNNWPNGTYFLALEDEANQKQMLTLVKQ